MRTRIPSPSPRLPLRVRPRDGARSRVRPGVWARARRGISHIEALVGLTIVALALMLVMGLVTMNDLGLEEGRGLFLKARLFYAAQRLEELKGAVRLYLDRTGRLPGDDPRATARGPGGDGNGRVDRHTERDTALEQLYEARLAPTNPPLLLGFPVAFYWMDGPFLGHASGGHYLVVEDCPVWFAKYMDREIDDGRSASGRAGWTQRRGSKTDFYVRFDP